MLQNFVVIPREILGFNRGVSLDFDTTVSHTTAESDTGDIFTDLSMISIFLLGHRYLLSQIA
jgi:hypothetical protein